MSNVDGNGNQQAADHSLDDLYYLRLAIEAVLSVGRPIPIQLADLERISEADRRNLILRATVATPRADLPQTLIVKKVVAERYDPDDTTHWDSVRFLRDWAGAAFLSQVAGAAGHGPRFYGGDRANGFILLEDMGNYHGSLVGPLLGDDEVAATVALNYFGERLGQLHVDTFGKAADYYALVATLNPTLAMTMRQNDEFAERCAKVTALLATLGVDLSIAAQAEVEQLSAVVADPGPFTVYRHGDPCPDNFFWQGTTLRLLDFEFGHMGHGLSDLAYARTFFPTCWCCNRVPIALVRRIETDYRTTFGRAYPAILDDTVFGRAMSEVCAIWVIDTLNWLLASALEADQEWGIAMIRPRIVARLEAFVATCLEFDQLPALRAVAEQLLTTLQQQWADLDPLPLFPAFDN